MKILNLEQGSGEWLKARLGVVTASEIDALVSPTGKVRTGQGPHSYLCRKVSEKVLGWVPPDAHTWNMEQGNLVESHARGWLAFEYDLDIRQVGFCVSDDGLSGCSPDGLIGEDGGVEIKAPTPPVQTEYLLAGELPEKYVLQVQYSLWVTQRKWWIFCSYNLQLSPLFIRVEPDPKIQAAISEAMADFAPKFHEAVKRIKTMKQEFYASKEAQHEANSR